MITTTKHFGLFVMTTNEIIEVCYSCLYMLRGFFQLHYTGSVFLIKAYGVTSVRDTYFLITEEHVQQEALCHS